MKPLNLIALLLFLGGALWALTRNDRVVPASKRRTIPPSRPSCAQAHHLKPAPANF